MMINDPAGIEWLYTGLTTDDEQEIVGLSKSDYETARAALESDTRRAERAEAEAQKTERARLYYQERVAELEAEAVEYRAQLIKAKAEAAQLRADLDAARAGQVQARCCYCNKPATIARTYYDSGFPSAREHLCPEHADNHPWHGTAIPPVPRPTPGGWNDTALGSDEGEG